MTAYKTIDDIRKLSQQSRFALFGEAATSNADVTAAVKASDSLSVSASGKTYVEETLMADQPLRMSQPMRNAMGMIRCQSEYHIPFLFRREASELSKVKGGESLLQAEKEALSTGIITKHLLPRAKTDICLWEITDTGYESLKKARPQWKSKGEYKHKFCAHRIADMYEQQGFRAKIEYQCSNGKLVDLCLKKNETIIFIEICASWPVLKELVNIEKDLQSHLLPNEIILAVTERKMKEALQKAISELNAGAGLMRPVKIALAGDLIEFLEMK